MSLSALVGADVVRLELPPLTLDVLQAYADASGDDAAVHLDEAEARAFGFPAPIAHGMLVMAWVARAVTDWSGPRALKAFNVRFMAPVLEGDQLTCTGTVVAVEEGRARLTLRVVDQAGGVKLEGAAQVLAG